MRIEDYEPENREIPCPFVCERGAICSQCPDNPAVNGQYYEDFMTLEIVTERAIETDLTI